MSLTPAEWQMVLEEATWFDSETWEDDDGRL